jgi:signal transduction histidine kinase
MICSPRCTARSVRHKRRWDLRGTVLRLEVAQAPLLCRCDRSRVYRALANLVTNAVKYSPAGGAITVSLDRQEDPEADWAVIRVMDQGLGIPATDLRHVFGCFYRARNVGTIHGTGLGLSGAKQRIEQHGGTISIASELGTGTAVTVRLQLMHAGTDDAGTSRSLPT